MMAGPWDGPGIQGALYSQCLRPGYAIGHFGFPYNDNVQQVGLSWDPAC